MLANELEITIYPQAGFEWHTEVMREPTWNQIEVAIHMLDRAEYPFLRVFLPRPIEGCEIATMMIIGGDGEYGLSGFDEKWRERWRYRDPTRPNGPKLIDIWTTDQGASFEETYLCADFDVVLRICKFFAQSGRLDPHFMWEVREFEGCC